MKVYNVVGKNSFTSKKGTKCNIIYTVFDVEPFGDMKGRMTKEIFLPEKEFSKVDVGDELYISYNDRGFVESVEKI